MSILWFEWNVKLGGVSVNVRSFLRSSRPTGNQNIIWFKIANKNKWKKIKHLRQDIIPCFLSAYTLGRKNNKTHACIDSHKDTLTHTQHSTLTPTWNPSPYTIWKFYIRSNNTYSGFTKWGTWKNCDHLKFTKRNKKLFTQNLVGQQKSWNFVVWTLKAYSLISYRGRSQKF